VTEKVTFLHVELQDGGGCGGLYVKRFSKEMNIL